MKCFVWSFLLLFSSLSSNAQYRNLEIKAAGLTCSLCSNAIQKALKGLPFITSVETELKSNIFRIALKPGMPINFDLISRKVEEAGFSIGELTVEVKFPSAAIANDAHVEANGQLFHFMNVKSGQVAGWQKVKLLDKSFVLQPEAKKLAKTTRFACYKTGFMEACCSEKTDVKVSPRRVLHVTI
ncbi:MAG: heavy-metal-associated domain-containing protein [Chitinophagaceae bacterium]|jgi:copper chaperone CopZ|nr:heavy-metal-associated domain-containing protein [Chitinophagaceae bacterium]